MEDTTGFAELGLRAELMAALESLGYEEPTAIQRAAIPPLLEGRDLLGQAATGTGKTAAFALPLLQRLEEGSREDGPAALVLVPTRELAMQVAQAVHRYGRRLGVRVLPVYGGQPIGRQLRALERGVDVVVATPGRALDVLRRGKLALASLRVVVLDEADEMLDMGFAEDIDAILEETPATRQTVLFSATMPARIAGLARRHLRDAVRIEIQRDAVMSAGEMPRVRQTAYLVPSAHKLAALGRVLDVEAPASALVFCGTRNEVDSLAEALNGRGYRAEALHGGMSQEQRDRVMGRLRSGTADLLVATDVAARGLDIDQLTHVINFDVPSAPDSYIHRIGRVGRAGREGVAITLLEPRQHRLVKNIERVTKRRIEVAKLPTVADLRTRRLELTRAALREAIVAEEGLDQYRAVVEPLVEEFDVMHVALAAVKLAQEASGADAEAHEPIPEVAVPAERPARDGRPRPRGASPRGDRPPRRKAPGGQGGTARIFIGAGRVDGIRPKDLVGAIANEAGFAGRDIGVVEIADRHSLVEVPEAAAPAVITALRRTRLRGKKPTVRRAP